MGGLLFSQRHGYAELPAPMHLEEISDDLRREIWNVTREILMSMRGISMVGDTRRARLSKPSAKTGWTALIPIFAMRRPI